VPADVRADREAVILFPGRGGSNWPRAGD